MVNSCVHVDYFLELEWKGKRGRVSSQNPNWLNWVGSGLGMPCLIEFEIGACFLAPLLNEGYDDAWNWLSFKCCPCKRVRVRVRVPVCVCKCISVSGIAFSAYAPFSTKLIKIPCWVVLLLDVNLWLNLILIIISTKLC